MDSIVGAEVWVVGEGLEGVVDKFFVLCKEKRVDDSKTK